jgi:hypothetical protein
VESSLEDVFPQLLGSGEIAEALGVPYRSLMHWVEQGLVNPFAGSKGSRAAALGREARPRGARHQGPAGQGGLDARRPEGDGPPPK